MERIEAKEILMVKGEDIERLYNRLTFPIDGNHAERVKMLKKFIFDVEEAECEACASLAIRRYSYQLSAEIRKRNDARS